MEILKSSLTGNIVGIISLIISIASFFITVITMKSAARIEKDIKKAEEMAVDKNHFFEYRERAVKKLELKRKSVQNEEMLSYSLCQNVLAILNDLINYKSVLKKEDIDFIDKKRNELKRIMKELYGTKTKTKEMWEYVARFDEIVAAVLNILKKGEYAL